jgi:GMP synthase (glutamine-hydrolysing)
MGPTLVIENDPLLPGAGWAGRALDAAGVPWRVVRAHAGETRTTSIDDIAGLVVLGGRQHAWQEDEFPQLAWQREAMRRLVDTGTPVLGICLGGQLLTRALGSSVFPARQGEYGWVAIEPTEAATSDPLFSSASLSEQVYLWHTDAFALPDGAQLLAATHHVDVQAFRYANAWAVQFHPEVDLATFDAWHANFPDAAALVGVDPHEARRTAARRELDEPPFARRMLEAFAGVIAANG